MVARAKKRNRSKRVDVVRASRDGHHFHEAWVARCALGLLLPRFDLYAIAVEGLSEEDEQGVSDAVVEIADATFYHGKGASFEASTRMEVAQFKYSISNADTPLRMADLRKTLVKFAATEKEFVSKHGGNAVARKVAYSINSHRPFAPETLEAFRAASTGHKAVSADIDAQLRQLRSAVKQSDDRLTRFAARVLLIGRMDSLEARARRHDAIVDMLVELSTVVAVDERGQDYLLAHPDLVVALGDSDALRRLFESKTAWAGSRHARLTTAYTTDGDLPEAFVHAKRTEEWLQWLWKQDERDRLDVKTDFEDYVGIALYLVASGRTTVAASYVDQWRSDVYSYRLPKLPQATATHGHTPFRRAS